MGSKTIAFNSSSTASNTKGTKLLLPPKGLQCATTSPSLSPKVELSQSALEKSIEDYVHLGRLVPLALTNQISELQTILRDKTTSRNDFKFYADRLIRLVIEESLNQLPYTKEEVITPTDCVYEGLKYQRGTCGVSIVRSGEVMEQGLRECCRSIRIGKILIESDADTHAAKIVYAKLPRDISTRKVLLMYPISSTGNTVMKAVSVLKEHGVCEKNIILSNIFVTPQSVCCILQQFPEMTLLTSEVHPIAPLHFGQKYFGTD